MEEKTKKTDKSQQKLKESNEKIAVEVPIEEPAQKKTSSKIATQPPAPMQQILPSQTVENQKVPVNTTIILLFIVVFLLGIVIGYLMSGPQFNPAFDISRVPFL